ncbi:MAG: hypothetical protein O3B47_03145 [bacterium]|nr:hypothetical protein [bacterium]
MKLKLNPLQQVTLLLAAFSLGAIVQNLSLKVFIHLGATLGFGLALFYLFTFLSRKKKNIYNTVISTLIIFLVLHYGIKTADVIYPIIVTFIAIFSKFFLERKNFPIINPVVFALLLTYLASTVIPSFDAPFISWWGTNYKALIGSYNFPLGMLLILVWMFFGLGKWRKYRILFSFLVAHSILLFLRTNLDATINFTTLEFTLSDATIYFFAAIMLIEPKSSPMIKLQQIIFGIIAALAYNLMAHFQVNHFDLFAIAIANLYFFGARTFKFGKNEASPKT